MATAHERLQLTPEHWFGWQMLPGYVAEGNVPYFSPIWVNGVIPRKTGRRILVLQFINVLYAEGVQDFSLDLRILKHEQSYLVSEILYQDKPMRYRTAIISHIEFEWIRRFCPELWEARPPSSFSAVEQGSVSRYLTTLFRPSR